MPYFLSRTRMFVLNDVMNDDMKYFKLHTALFTAAIVQCLSTRPKIARVSVVTNYDLFTAYTVMCNSNTLLPMPAN